MSLQNIEAAVIAAYLQVMPTLPTAYEGDKAFTPPATAMWAQVHHLPSGCDPVTIGVLGEDEQTGVFQIDINLPENASNSRPTLNKAIDDLKAVFVGGKYLTHKGHHTLIRKAEASAKRRVDGWLRISLSVYYTSRQQRGAL